MAFYPWPANGTRDVPLTFESHELPSPYDAVPGASQLGYLLSVNLNGPWDFTRGVELGSVSLVPDGGAPVAVTGVDRNSPNGGYMRGGFALFPHQPLAYGTWYKARATGRVLTTISSEFDSRDAHLPFDFTWRFKTRQLDPGTSADGESDGRVAFSSGTPRAGAGHHLARGPGDRAAHDDRRAALAAELGAR